MAFDKVVDSAALDTKFSSIANALRNILGISRNITDSEMPDLMDDINNEVNNTQTSLISQIKTALEGKAAGTQVQIQTGEFTWNEADLHDGEIEIPIPFNPDIVLVRDTEYYYEEDGFSAWTGGGTMLFYPDDTGDWYGAYAYLYYNTTTTLAYQITTWAGDLFDNILFFKLTLRDNDSWSDLGGPTGETFAYMAIKYT